MELVRFWHHSKPGPVGRGPGLADQRSRPMISNLPAPPVGTMTVSPCAPLSSAGRPLTVADSTGDSRGVRCGRPGWGRGRLLPAGRFFAACYTVFPAMKPVLAVVLPAAAALTLSSCGGGSRHDVEEIYFLVSANVKIPYWQAAAAGLARAGDQLKVKYEMLGPD